MPQAESGLLAVLVELLEEGDQVLDLLLVLDADEDQNSTQTVMQKTNSFHDTDQQKIKCSQP